MRRSASDLLAHFFSVPESRLVGIVIALFVVATALEINGSSIAVWKDALRDDTSPSGLLFSTAKSVRSDEWMAWTPSIISQALHQPPFPTSNSNLGAGKAPLLMSVPARHFAMLFRPQLYGFFLFGVERGFAFYWNFKTAALFLGFFFLCHILTRGDFVVSLFGACWLLFSAYVQWWFSCPPMLPEMLAAWSIGIVCILQIFATASRTRRSFAALGLVIAAIDFALCCYPPFQIPLVYLGVAIVGTWLWQHRHETFHWRAASMTIALAIVAIAAVLVAYFIECKPTLQIVAQTRYPGARRVHGGELRWRDTFNGILGFFNADERNFLDSRGNPSEASNFYPLWIFALIGGGKLLWRERRARRVEIAILFCLAIATLYSFCALPQWLCHATLLDFVTGTRVLLAIGVSGILLTVLMLSRARTVGTSSRRPFLAAGATSIIIIALIALSVPDNGRFLTPMRIALLLALNIGVVGFYFFAPARAFCLFFAACLVVANGSVNPIATGLGPLLEAEVAPTIRQLHEADPGAKWVAYSNAWLPQLLKAQGVDVVNGLNVVPDLQLARELDPSGAFDEVYNRYAFAIYEYAPPNSEHKFHVVNPSAYAVAVAPTDPVLAARDVRYAVCGREIPSASEAGLKVIAQFPRSRIWIYRITPSPWRSRVVQPASEAQLQ